MQCPIIKEYHPHPWMMRAPLVIPHPSKKQHIKLKVQACIRPSLQLISINNHSQQLSFFCAGYPAWSFTYPSLHLTIPQKYRFTFVSDSQPKQKGIKTIFPWLTFKKFLSKLSCLKFHCPEPLGTIWYHWVPLGYHWGTIHWVPLGTILVGRVRFSRFQLS